MLPKRTKITHLSNGELFILDFLALEGRSNFKNLCEENYSIHMNCEYSHDFNDRELLRVLNTLKYEQYITVNNNYSSSFRLMTFDIPFSCIVTP